MPDRNPFVITGKTEHLVSLKLLLIQAHIGLYSTANDAYKFTEEPAIKALLEAIDKGIERNKGEKKDIIKYKKKP